MEPRWSPHHERTNSALKVSSEKSHFVQRLFLTARVGPYRDTVNGIAPGTPATS